MFASLCVRSLCGAPIVQGTGRFCVIRDLAEIGSVIRENKKKNSAAIREFYITSYIVCDAGYALSVVRDPWFQPSKLREINFYSLSPYQ